MDATTWIEAIAAVVQAGAAMVIVKLTNNYVDETKRLLAVNEKLLQTNQALVLAQNTPHVSAILKTMPSGNGSGLMIACEIENVGTGPAYNVKLQCRNPKSPAENTLAANEVFSGVIDFMAPLRPITYVIGPYHDCSDINMQVDVGYDNSVGERTVLRPYLLRGSILPKG